MGASNSFRDRVQSRLSEQNEPQSSFRDRVTSRLSAQNPLMRAAEEKVNSNGYVSMADLNRQSNKSGTGVSIDGANGTFRHNYGYGNIDLTDRPVYRNPDGTISTVDSFSANFDGKEVLLPQIGRDASGNPVRWTEDQAIDNYLKTGENLGSFDTVDAANNYANWLHNQQADYYGDKDAPKTASAVSKPDTADVNKLYDELNRLRDERGEIIVNYASNAPTMDQWKRQQELDAQIADLEGQLKKLGVDPQKGNNLTDAAHSVFMQGISGAAQGVTSTLDFVNRLGHYALGWTPEEYDAADTFTKRLNEQQKQNVAYWSGRKAEALGDDEGARNVAELGVIAVQALPAAISAMVSGGASFAGETANLVSAANSAGITSWVGQTADSIRNVLISAINNPQFYSSFWSVLGNGYEDAKANGASDANAVAYALTNGGINALIEIGGGIETPGESALQTAAEEATEEYAQRKFEKGLEMMYGKQNKIFSTTDPDAIFNPIEDLKASASGAFAGGLLGAGQIAVNSLIADMYTGVRPEPVGAETTATVATADQAAGVAPDTTPSTQNVTQPVDIPEITREMVRAVAADPAQLAELGISTKGKDGSQIRGEVRLALEARRDAQIKAAQTAAKAQENINKPTEWGWYGEPDTRPVAGENWYSQRTEAPAAETPAETPAESWYGTPPSGNYGNNTWYQAAQVAEEQAQRTGAANTETVNQYVAGQTESGAFSPRMSETMKRMYIPSQDATGYIQGMTAAYNAGRDGKAVNTVNAPALNGMQLQAAYIEGQAAAKQSVAGTQTTAYNNAAKEAENHVEENKGSSKSEERDAGLDSGGPGGSLSARTGDVSEGAEARKRRAESVRAAVAANEESRAVSPAEQGINNGSTEKTMTLMPESMEDEDLQSVRQDAKDAGYEVRFFTGDIKRKNGTDRAAVDLERKIVWIAADDEFNTARELWEHEKYHTLPENQKRKVARRLMRRNRKELKRLIDRYVDIYGWTDMPMADVLEEILADAYAGIDVFDFMGDDGANLFTYDTREEVSKVTGSKTTRGPPRGTKASRRLTEEDLDAYMKAGGRRNKVKQEALERGDKVILTTEEEIGNYITDAISGERMPTVAYGVANESVAEDALAYSNGKVDITDDYLEFVADDLKHAWDEHSQPKEEGDLPLTEEDFQNIPEYFDTYDNFLFVEQYQEGPTRLAVSKDIGNGKIVIIETVSKSRGALQFKNIIGQTYEKYQRTYGQYEKKSPEFQRGQTPQSLRDGTTSNDNVTPKAEKSNTPNENASERAVGVATDYASESAYPQKFSERTFRNSDYVQNREKAAKDLSERLGVSVTKAKKYIDAVNSVAKMIADDRTRLDYEASPGRSAVVSNSDYGASIDFSTICKKRRLYTGTMEAIQKAMPDKALTADEMLKIRAEMKKRGYEVSCGLCYVEGSRAKMGEYAKAFIDLYKKYYPNAEWVPTMYDVNTPDGAENMRVNHPEVYKEYEHFWNHYGTLRAGDKNLFSSQGKPKLFQSSTEYNGELLKMFRNPAKVAEKNLNGGLRLQSFSDFEIIHLIDCMQVIMDMSRVGLAGQAYTKVPDFAWALGKTGLKINLSMIAKGVDADGHIIFDEVEGMKYDDAKALRDAYSKNVGTILVVFDDAQLKAAMADDFVDFIIPFHRSQWKTAQYDILGLPAGATDYTTQQTEAYLDGRKGKNGKPLKPKDFMSNEYWDFSKTGKENAEEYLRMCAEDGRRPVFYKLLVDNGDGSFSLQPDGSTDGYWKLLTDFKMYDNKGKGSPQMPVRPDFNMEEAERMLNDYQGGHANFPVAQDVVDDFVNQRFSSRPSAEQMEAYAKAYGKIKTGENPVRDVTIPKRTTPKTKVSMTVRTVAEAGATPEEFVPTIENLVDAHEFDYTPYSDKKAIANADRIAAEKGWSATLTDWVKEVSAGGVSKTNTAIGWALYNNAVNAGDTETALLVLRNIVKHQRNAAQAVQATRILKQLNPETQLYNAERTIEGLKADLQKKYGDAVPDLEIDPDLAERFLKARTQEGRDKALNDIYRDIGKQMPSNFMDRWTAFRYTAMLGNPRTIIRNIAGNAGFAPIVAAKDLTATAIEGIVNAATGGKLERTKGNPLKSGLLKAAWNDYAAVQEQAMGQSKYSDRQMANKEIQDARKIFGNTRSKAWNKTGGAALEGWRKATNWAMDTTDVWFNKPQYVLAMAQYCAANGISAEQIRSGKGLDKARAYAINEAQKATYRDTNDFSQMVSSLGKGWLKSENKWKRGIATLGEGVLPFRKTPANILARGIEYSPIGMLKSLTYDLAQVKKGNMAASEMIDNLSAGLTGTGLLALGAYLAAQGLLKGRGGSDDKKKKFEDLQGHQDYALELPDGTSITLDWLAPEALPMFIGANLWETATEEKEDIKLKDVLSAIGNVTEPMLSMSMLSSLNELLNGTSYSKDGEINALTSKLSSAATSYLTQAFPTLLGQIERTGEDKRMTTYTDKNSFLTSDMQYTLGKISAKVPFFDYNQIPYIDAWGREELTGNFISRAANNFFNPSYISKVNESDMEKELERLYDETGENVFPQRAAKYFNVDGERKDLTAEEYLTYATERGRASYAIVGGMVESDLYKGMTDAEKAACIEDAYSYANQTARTAVGGNISDSWVEKALTGVNRGIAPETYIMLRNMTNDIEGIKDSNGKTIANSKGLQIMETVYSIPGLNDEQRRYLNESFGVGSTVIGYNKTLVNEKLAGMRHGETTTTTTTKTTTPKTDTADVTGSTVISKATYDPAKETASVTYKSNGKTYTYEGITQDDWDAFKASDSKGSYIRNWK